MWEAIRQNRRRSFVLITLMAIVLIALGAAIGVYIDPQQGLVLGATAAVGLWLILWLTAVAAGDSILLSSVNAHEIWKEDAPQLWNVVEEMTIASGLGKMPRVYVIDDSALNAFAVGRQPEKAAVAVTAGLLRKLNRDELQGVVAHEIGHIRNLDVKFMTLAGVMVGSIVLISDVFLRALFYGGGRRRSRGGGKGGGQAAAIMLLVAIALAILGPIFAQLLYFACSRRREYLADASSARFTRYPEGLASALEKISGRASSKSKSEAKANRVMAPMYIVNPLQARSAAGLTSTHPPTEKRIQILRSMGGQAGFAAYEAAYRQATGAKRGCIGARTLESDAGVAVRPPAPEDRKKDATERARQASDLVDRMAEYLFLACACGVRIKIPPDFQGDKITCPRCGREHEIPAAELAAVAGATAAAVGKGVPGVKKASPPPPPPMRYRRKGAGWESFRCRCGQTVQLSPSLSTDSIRCPKCRTRIAIDGGSD
jgi:heat shock protein HtpX